MKLAAMPSCLGGGEQGINTAYPGENREGLTTLFTAQKQANNLCAAANLPVKVRILP